MLAQKVQKLSTKDQVVTGFQQRSRNYVFMENLGDKVTEEEVEGCKGNPNPKERDTKICPVGKDY